MFPRTTNVANAFTQPPAYSTTPVQNWGGSHGVFGNTSTQQLPSWGQNNTSASNGSWTQHATLGNPFQSNIFPPTSNLLSGGPQNSSPPPLIPPRAGPVKEPPKVDTDAFVDLDPLGEKEKRDIKEMFKDFQMAKPPHILAKNGEMADLAGFLSSVCLELRCEFTSLRASCFNGCSLFTEPLKVGGQNLFDCPLGSSVFGAPTTIPVSIFFPPVMLYNVVLLW